MNTKGDKYEDRAAELLCRHGLHIVARNFAGKTGEIDIIARDGQILVFVEVRARNNPNFLSAAGSVDRRKQQRIIRTAYLYLQGNKQWANSPCRFDVIAFEPRQSTPGSKARWIRSAFTE